MVSDDGEYRPGHIAAMFRKNRKRRYSIDSDDSINMEATFDEIQKEEKRRYDHQLHLHGAPSPWLAYLLTN